jgi:hypothetical protein
MALVECLLSVLYSSMNAATARLACSRVAKWRRLSNSNSRVELNDSETALSRAEPVRPMDWVTPALRQAFTKRLPVYSPPWSVLSRIRLNSDYAEVCVKPRMSGDGLRSWGVVGGFSA